MTCSRDLPVPEYLQQTLPVYEIAEQYWDLKFIPSQYVFTLLSMVSEDKLERDKCLELSSSEGQEEWLNYCRRPRRTILEVLQDFHKSTSKLTIPILFELFSTIKPRAFSIASSSVQTDGQTLDILVAVVNYYSKMKTPRLGLASNWLASLRCREQIYGWFKPGTFYFPEDIVFQNTPCIMIGPGTGLAPFRGFILDRVALGTASKDSLILVFGCRYKTRDFHCREKIEELANKNLITLFCAFSRDQENKIYVQHKLKEQKDLIWTLINDRKAYVYISGNGKNMPDNVKDTFIEDIIVAKGGLGVDEAKNYVKDMENKGRYQVETW